MKLKTSLFNCGLLRSNVRRFWPLFLAYFGVLILTISIPALTEQDSSPVTMVGVLENYLGAGSIIINFIMAVSAAMGVYGFMYNQRTCGMVASLPIKRKSIFLSSAASGILPVLIINLLIGLITVLPFASQLDRLAVKALLIWFAVTSMHYIAFFGIASIIAVITGNIVALPAFYVIFNFLALGVETALKEIFSDFIYGFTDAVTALSFEFLSPAVHMLGYNQLIFGTAMEPDSRVLSSVAYSEWRLTLIYAAVGIAFLVAAMLIFRKRKMENCGDIIAVPFLRPWFKYGVAICTAMANGILLRAIIGVTGDMRFDVSLYLIYLIIGAFIGYFGSEMLLRKRFAVFKGNWLGFAVLSIVCAAFLWCCVTDYAGIGSRVPEEINVEHVELGIEYSTDKLDLYDAYSISSAIELSKSIIDNKDSHLSAGDDSVIISIDYYLNNGRIISREYSISADSKDFAMFSALSSSAEAKAYLTTPDVDIVTGNLESGFFSYYNSNSGEYSYIELTGVQAVDFFRNGYSADINDGNLNYCRLLSDNRAYAEIQFIDRTSKEPLEGHLHFMCYIDINCKNSISWVLENLGIDLTEYLTGN